jgi:hypothetical protein
MSQRYIIFFCLVVLTKIGFAQITTVPAFPVASQPVTIIFDSSKESRLGYFTGDLYTHTGVIIEGNTAWQHVIGSWGNNTVQPKLTNKGNGIYELQITPNVNSFYSVPGSEKVVKLAFVFRSADAQKQTNDLFVTINQEGLVVQISQPTDNSIINTGKNVTIVATASISSDLKLTINGTTLYQTTGTSIAASKLFSESGNFLIVASATASGISASDSVYVCVKGDVVEQAKPSAYRKGINYPSDTSAALVLWAPGKNYVFVLGDFNDWKPENEYLMKKDGDYFWLELPNLVKGKEYRFQYYIDSKIKIADPYTEKIADPSNDKYITSDTYPGLISYPVGKTDGITSILQPGQAKYNWEATNFQVPAKEKLSIYELLVRDFTSDHTFRAVTQKLDYLQDLRINVLELMPVNEFEGNSSWGYNPSFYFAPDKYYGPKNDLKKLIDECHKRGIAVVLDMVLNHSYGQSPFVQMYMDNWTVTPDNPWYNITSPNTTYSWGYDFNHQSPATQELVDSINSFWINEYKVDGFRFDFTKGFTNTPGDGWAFDASRITILERMAGEIRKRKPDALIIFEHFTDNSEEKVLSDYGIMIWGNLNGKYGELAMGYNQSGNSDLSWGVYDNRGWAQPNLVTYQESHDEERLTYKCEQYGNSENNYNIKQLPTALKRMALNFAFHIPLPGPKMIWQFGERGYDVSIDDYGGRVSEKPPRWEYMSDTNRVVLFGVVAKLNYLKETYSEFVPQALEYGLTSEVKWYHLGRDGNHVFVVGNFATSTKTTTVNFPALGLWYEYFTKGTINIGSTSQSLTLAPGEFRFYTTRQLDYPVISGINDIEQTGQPFFIYPNPANSKIVINSVVPFSNIEIWSLTGNLVFSKEFNQGNLAEVAVGNMPPGMYIVCIESKNRKFNQKLIIR